MRGRLRLLAVAGTLLLLLALAWVATRHLPERDYVTGLWPIGLGTGAVVLTAPRWRLPVALAVGATGALAVHLSDVAGGADEIAIGYGVTAAVEVWVAARVLRRPDGHPPALRTDDDLRRYFGAAVAAAAVAAVGVATTYVKVGDGPVGRAALGVGMAHLASHLYLVPFFLRLPVQGAIARNGERVAQWVVLVVGTPLILVPDSSPALAFLVIPLLAWGALRITPIESLLQLVGVLAVAVVLTSFDQGPFADLPERYDLPGDLRGVLLSAFCATCAVMVTPMILRVGEYVGAARSSEAERALVQGIVDGATGVAIIGTDEAGRITLFNPGAERLLGYPAKEMLGKHPSIFYTDDSIAEKAEHLGTEATFLGVFLAMVDRGAVGEPVRFRRKDGTERIHAMTVSRLGDPGRVTGYVSTSEDITDRLDTEQALRDALEAEHRAVERLEEVDEVKDQFVSTVSHELRTPITSIIGYLEMLTDGEFGDLEKPQVDALVRVQANSRRLLSLIDDLLTLSRVAEDGLQTKDTFDLRHALSTAYQLVSPSWDPPRWLDVTLTLPETPIPTYGNEEMLERLFVNLLSNAVKFTDDGGSVTVSVVVDDSTGQSMVRVADTGIGIPSDEQSQLFTRFFRSSLAQGRAIQGSGLGLSISRAIAEHHGGTIEVSSEEGVGTKIDVRLPLHDAARHDGRDGNVEDSTTVDRSDRTD